MVGVTEEVMKVKYRRRPSRCSWIGILETEAFTVRSTYHTTKGKSPGQLVFGQDMTPPINHVADWRYIRQRKQKKIENCVIWGNANITDHDYRVGDKLMALTKLAYKYKTPYSGLYKIVQTWKNGTVTPIMGAVSMRINIHNTKTYNNPIVEGRDPT